MSMLSSQCDKLRDRAKQVRLLSDGVKAPYVLLETKEHTWLAMRSAANDMERAANTILSLRDKLSDMVDCRERARALEEENAKLRELASNMYKNMQGVLLLATDTVWASDLVTLRDCMDEHMEIMAELGMPPRDYEIRRRELGIEVQ